MKLVAVLRQTAMAVKRSLSFVNILPGKPYLSVKAILTLCKTIPYAYLKLAYTLKFSKIFSGNMNNELIYELGKPCGNDSDCSTGRCSKKSGLCMKCPKKD